MKVDKYLKSHKANEFYVKKCRGYYLVMDNYDKSLASMEVTEEEAKKVAEQLKSVNAKRVGSIFCRSSGKGDRPEGRGGIIERQ